MCQTFYKYFLITSTSFMASSGLYFASLTLWLWPLPIHDYSPYDWRLIPQSVGTICLFLFSAGLLIVLRSRPREILVFTIILYPLLAGLIVLLIVQGLNKDRNSIFDLSDIFLLVVLFVLIAIIINLCLLRRSLQRKLVCSRMTRRRDDLMEVDL